MKRTIIALLKNHKFEYWKEDDVKEKWKDAEYILFPSTKTKSFIPVIPTKMLSMSKVEIEYKLKGEYQDYACNSYYSKEGGKYKFETSSIIEMYNYIHSIDFMYYFNSLAYDNIGYSSTIGMEYLDITIYRGREMLCQERIKGRKDEDGMDGIMTILRALNQEQIYVPLHPTKSEWLYFNMASRKWKRWRVSSAEMVGIKNEANTTYECWGVYNVDVNSIYIADITLLKDLSKIEFIKGSIFSLEIAAYGHGFSNYDFEAVSVEDYLAVLLNYEELLKCYYIWAVITPFNPLEEQIEETGKILPLISFHYYMKLGYQVDIPVSYRIGAERYPLQEYLNALDYWKEHETDELHSET